MFILNNITDSIEVVLTGAITTSQLQVMTSYRDITSSAYTPGRQLTNTNNTTPVSICNSPSSGVSRVLDLMTVFNTDTANAEVTVRYNANSSIYVLHRAALSPGEVLTYQDGTGWSVHANTGAIKSSINQGNNATSSALTAVILGSDQTNNNAVANTMQDVTGLSFPVVSGGTYFFRATIIYTAAATTTGSRWSINGPTTSQLIYRSEYSLTATSRTVNDGLSAYDSPAASNASSAATGSNVALIEGYITVTANGTVVVRFASEVSASAIIAKTGSTLYYQRVI